jgi:L-lactate dehydrogenase complex protein LldF
VRVHWAEGPEEAHQVLLEIVRRRGVRRAVKAKSMLTEELGVNPFLESLGVEVFETDLGEYLIQLLGEPPSHIVGPAIHLSLEEIRRLFHERFGTPLEASPEALAAWPGRS